LLHQSAQGLFSIDVLGAHAPDAGEDDLEKGERPELACAVQRRRFSVGANPTRQFFSNPADIDKPDLDEYNPIYLQMTSCRWRFMIAPHPTSHGVINEYYHSLGCFLKDI
jgi:hypothetical protein